MFTNSACRSGAARSWACYGLACPGLNEQVVVHDLVAKGVARHALKPSQGPGAGTSRRDSLQRPWEAPADAESLR